MIREERDPEFWVRIAGHPEVLPHLMGVSLEVVETLVQHEKVIPLASENGGYLFTRIDGFGRVLELHSMFTPRGRGREAHRAGCEALERLFPDHCAVITYEVQGNPLSRPPKSFGFKPLEDFRETEVATVRTWILTREAWEQSPARQRMRA